MKQEDIDSLLPHLKDDIIIFLKEEKERGN
jgi:hypothetical protein